LSEHQNIRALVGGGSGSCVQASEAEKDSAPAFLKILGFLLKFLGRILAKWSSSLASFAVGKQKEARALLLLVAHMVDLGILQS
jgi:hypothetical protein